MEKSRSFWVRERKVESPENLPFNLYCQFDKFSKSDINQMYYVCVCYQI